ncbi:GYD domain-containing protein [Bradyrhizobium sp. MOS003]|uniref:GYD domain-containing protein n=1 Tax=Bradyrhizobium sp. MOS003 TaxID=2133946 RepID=UPI001FE1C3A7|nr:GYD domain-containing protein [Bradyrhizobium sp. MOS003]
MHESRHRDVPNSWKSSTAFMPTAGKESSSRRVQRPSRPVRNGPEVIANSSEENLPCIFASPDNTRHAALNAILENPATNRQEAARKLIEAAGGKLVSMYSVAADGPGVLVIFDVPDPTAAPAISGLTVTAGTLQNVKLVRLFTQDEIKQVRQNAAKLRPSYSPPGS